MSHPKLIVISGPSGCGKTTIAREILTRYPDIGFSVSATTRPKRNTEVEGKDYFFISKNEFEKKINQDELIEWEQIYGDYYGSLKSEVEKAINNGTSILFDIDVKGALSIKEKYPKHSILIFIKPPSLKLLTDRLRNRKTETAETLNKRMERVTMELDRAKEFDHCVVNDVLDKAVTSVDAIITDEMIRKNNKF
ncbi:MAG: guanylate kinase [Bacteroidota bacterium]|nr:guanylate kinase [Bacteroidota bacterium]